MLKYLILLLPILIYSRYLLVSYLKKRNRFKKGIYEISASYENNKIRYHILMERRHGKFIDARKLSKKSISTIPIKLGTILTSTFDNYEDAQLALQQFKEKI